MGIRLHFGDADWERIERDYSAWWAHELPRPLVYLTGVELDPKVTYPEVYNLIVSLSSVFSAW
jgi:hypothetical protein